MPNLLAIPEDHEYYHTERVAKEMQLIPGALKCDFMHFMVKAFVRSCIMMIEGMTSSSNLVVVLDSAGWSMFGPYMDSWYKLSFRLVWSQWPYQALSAASKIREQVAFSLEGHGVKAVVGSRFFLEKMMPKEAFTPNILHPLTNCYWSGHYTPERCWLRPFDPFQDVASTPCARKMDNWPLSHLGLGAEEGWPDPIMLSMAKVQAV